MCGLTIRTYQVLREEMGNLVVQTPTGERTWEMTDLYVAVAQTQGAAQNAQAREKLYAGRGPVPYAGQQGAVKPMLMEPGDFERLPARPRIPFSSVGDFPLRAVYVVDAGGKRRYLTEDDCTALGLHPSEALRYRDRELGPGLSTRRSAGRTERGRWNGNSAWRLPGCLADPAGARLPAARRRAGRADPARGYAPPASHFAAGGPSKAGRRDSA